jgi:cytochrome c biogenesis protein CcmG/thiol:disulfide interchange protein DsbE
VKHPARLAAGAVLVVLVVLAVVLATRPPYQATEVDGPLVGHAAPPFSGHTLSGTPVDLARYRGKWLYLNFFASWCAPCQAEEPNLVQFDFAQQHSADGAQLVSVVFQDSDAAAASFAKAQGATGWPTVADPGGATANAYGVSAPPTTFLIDPQGRIVNEWLAPLTVSQLNRSLSEARQAEEAP